MAYPRRKHLKLRRHVSVLLVARLISTTDHATTQPMETHKTVLNFNLKILPFCVKLERVYKGVPPPPAQMAYLSGFWPLLLYLWGSLALIFLDQSMLKILLYSA